MKEIIKFYNNANQFVIRRKNEVEYAGYVKTSTEDAIGHGKGSSRIGK